MYNEKTNNLEQKLTKAFGKNASLAITNAKLGGRGYMVRIESQGIPVTVDACKPTNEEAEGLALEEFEKQLDETLREKLLPTQPLENYEKLALSKEQMDKLYKHVNMPIKSLLKAIKEKTSAVMCQLNDGRYECVITGPYMNLHARGTARTREIALAIAMWVAHDIFSPYPIKVGDWPIRNS